MNPGKTDKREKWIDILRGIAILAVVYTHSFYFFPQFINQLFRIHSLFSVNWFIFLSGFANVLSFSTNSDNIWKKIIKYWKKRFAIAIPYTLASFSYMVFYNWNSVAKVDLVSRTFNFSSHQQFYFIQVILQLYLIFPFLFLVLKKAKSLHLQLIFVLLLGFISLKISTMLTPPWVYQSFFMPRLIAYLPIFTFAIFFFLQYRKINRLAILLSIPVFILSEINIISTRGGFITFVPNIQSILWSIASLLIAKIFADKITRNLITDILGYLGRRSLFIYLFHFIILEFLVKTYFAYSLFLYIIYFNLSIALSIVLEKFYTTLFTHIPIPRM